MLTQTLYLQNLSYWSCVRFIHILCVFLFTNISTHNYRVESNIFDAFFTLTTSIHDYKRIRQGIIITLDLLFITPKLHPFVFVFKGQKYGIQYHKI